MPTNATEKLNETVGEEVSAPCLSCWGTTAHSVIASIDQNEEYEYNIDWNWHYQIIRCRGCKTTSFREFGGSSEDAYQVGPNEWELAWTERLFPARAGTRRDLGDDSKLLPAGVRMVYEEVLQALANNSPILAGLGLRTLVEAVCEEKSAEGRTLEQKINDLANQKIATPAAVEILHGIRMLGNRAAHEIAVYREDQLGLAMDVIENLLREVYILPSRFSAAFSILASTSRSQK